MMTSYVIRGACLLLVTFSCSVAHASEPWTVIGAGNVTCKEWGRASPAAQNEVLSWMTGFASAVNIGYASNGNSQIPLNLLTYDYLRHKITLQCSSDLNSNVTMLVVVFKVIKESPFKGQW